MSSLVENKNLYKIFLSIIKYIPTALAILKIISMILTYCKITAFACTCLGGTSIAFLILLYLISYIFKFCLTHRLPLYYVSLITLMTVFDYYIRIPIETFTLYKLYAFISGLFIVIWIIVWFVNRKNPKIDHIKQLCESYVSCCK